jgi:hypothetical protein
MTLINAMRFFARVRREPELRDRVAAIGEREVSAELLCSLAGQEGLPCGPAELAEAFRLDWGARWAHFSRAARPKELAES